MKDHVDVSLKAETAWPMVPISEIADHCLGKMLDKHKNRGTPKPYLRNLNVRWFDFDTSDILEMRFEDHEAERYQARKGDLIVCEGGYPGRAAIWQDEEPIFLQKALHRVRFHEPERAKWVLYWLHFSDLSGSLAEAFSGTGIQHFTKAALSRFEVPLPPLEEQKRIVAVLDQAFAALDRARANAEANFSDTDELFQRAAGAIFESLLHEHPEVSLSAITKKITKGSSPKWQGISYVDEPGVLFVTSENVGTNALDFTKTKYVEEAFNQKDKKSILQRGDVLTNIVGASIGRTAVFDRHDVANINQAVCLIRCDQGKLNNHFLAYLLNSPYFKKMLHEGEVNMARANLSLSFFRDFRVPLPPVAVQNAIVENIDTLRQRAEEAKLAYYRDLSDLMHLRQSLLLEAFAGHLS